MNKKIFIIASLILFFSFGVCRAEERVSPVAATVHMIKSKIRIGDEVRLLVQVDRPRKFKILPLDPKINVAPFEIKSIDGAPVVKGQNRIQEIYGVTLTVFEIGDLKIPSFSIRYEDGQGNAGEAKTEPVSVKVVSIGKKLTDKDDIRPIKGPVSLDLEHFKDVLLSLTVFLLSVLLIVLIILRRIRESKNLESRKPIHERVKIELNRLKDQGFLEEKNYKAYYSEFSNILRRYLERRFTIEALDRTSTEILEELKSASLSGDITGKIAEVLNESDLVKFAKFAPNYELSGQLENMLSEIVESTTPDPKEHPREHGGKVVAK